MVICRCVLTGFGSFGSIERNPTEALIQSLSLEDSSTVTYHTSIIKVSQQHVDAWMRDTFQTLVEAAKDREEDAIVFIHLGVSETSSEIKLERYAYNECDFRIPDVTGAQPRHVAIHEHKPWNEREETGLEVMDIAMALEGTVGCVVSEDPGRYVCNYLYYRSLIGCQESRYVGLKLDSLFVHVPKEDCLPLDELKTRILSLIEHILSI